MPKISELTDAPAWLKSARVENEDVEIINGRAIWRGTCAAGRVNL